MNSTAYFLRNNNQEIEINLNTNNKFPSLEFKIINLFSKKPIFISNSLSLNLDDLIDLACYIKNGDASANVRKVNFINDSRSSMMLFDGRRQIILFTINTLDSSYKDVHITHIDTETFSEYLIEKLSILK